MDCIDKRNRRSYIIKGVKFLAIKIKLFDLLLIRNISQRKFSLMVGIRPNTINAYCNESIKRIEIKDLDRICKALQIELHELIEFRKDDFNE